MGKRKAKSVGKRVYLNHEKKVEAHSELLSNAKQQLNFIYHSEKPVIECYVKDALNYADFPDIKELLKG